MYDCGLLQLLLWSSEVEFLSGPRVRAEEIAQQEAHERPAVYSREPSKRFPSATLGSHGMGGGYAAAWCYVDGSRILFRCVWSVTADVIQYWL